MPIYDYLCSDCGPFTETRPMDQSDRPQPCPHCGGDAPRAFLTAPYLAAMTAERRLAHAINERSASAPPTLSALRQSHGSGCGCCSGKSMRYNKGHRANTSPKSTKSFPSRRPWMLSH